MSYLPYTPLDAHTAHLVHFVCEWLAILLGVQLYRHGKRRHQHALPQHALSHHTALPVSRPHTGLGTGLDVKTDTVTTTGGLLDKGNFAVVIGCIVGAGVGNKMLFVLENPQLWGSMGWQSLLLGQTVVGGLIGGLLGVEIAKKLVGIRHSTGDFFVVPFCVGLMVGRVGCFLAGLHDDTYGVATALPWGVDFGDGVLRHPTQLYDIIWAGLMLLLWRGTHERLSRVSGLSFKLMFASYLLWRLLIDGIKPVPYAYGLGLSGIQWACLLVLMAYLPLLYRDWCRLRQKEASTANSL